MEYSRMIAISGMPGLFELVSSKNEGAVVKSLEDQTVKFVSSRVHNFSHLESIEIYTVRDNVNLVDVLKAMEASSEALPSDKDGAAVKTYMEKVFPDLDFERVYSSDMKKMVKWYGILKANGVEIKTSQAEEAEEETTEEAGQVDADVAAPAEPKATSKKKAAAAEPTSDDVVVEPDAQVDAPKKKAAKKKTEE
ncbi:MAG: DUF5606 domain-containing protein [Bacteroidota bacterium]